MISLNKLPMLIIFSLIKLGESNMTHSDNIVALFLQGLLLQIEVAVDMDKTNGIHTETGLGIARLAAGLIITGTNIETIVITTLDKIIRTTFTNNSGIETEVDIREERIIVVIVGWEVGQEILNRSCKRC